MEVWKNIDILDGGYSVSNTGKVRNNKTNRILKTKFNKIGYERITITYKSKQYNFQIHRLVLSTFNPIKNFEEYDCHHKDWNIKNNCVDNLEWLPSKINQENKIMSSESFKTFKNLLIDIGDDELNHILKQIEKGWIHPFSFLEVIEFIIFVIFRFL